jgi:hypothetical protein
MTRLEAGVSDTLARWDIEAELAAARAFKAGRTPVLVTYPTGKQMVRFAEFGGEYGVRNEVRPEVWDRLVRNNGKVYF